MQFECTVDALLFSYVLFNTYITMSQHGIEIKTYAMQSFLFIQIGTHNLDISS